MTEMGEFGPGQDWDARAHVRLLRTNGGASSGYTADLIERLYTELIAAALAYRPSQGGEWVMVPREPTAEMRLAGKEEHLAQEAVGGFRSDQAVSIYRAMLSASPSPYGVEAGVVRDALTASRSVIVGLIAAEYNIETWGLKQRLAAIDAALSLTKDQSNG